MELVKRLKAIRENANYNKDGTYKMDGNALDQLIELAIQEQKAVKEPSDYVDLLFGIQQTGDPIHNIPEYVFIEANDPEGNSISIGKWLNGTHRADGCTTLRLSVVNRAVVIDTPMKVWIQKTINLLKELGDVTTLVDFNEYAHMIRVTKTQLTKHLNRLS